MPGEKIGKIHADAKMGSNSEIEENVKIGACRIGDNAHLRSGTVIYQGNAIGDGFTTGHNALVRENNKIGNGVSIGTNAVVERDSFIGDRVRIHSGAFICEYATLKDDCWVGPRVALTNAPYPKGKNVKEKMMGAIICEHAKIGANATILPFLRIGRHALVGAGAVVTKDVPDYAIVAGNPAKVIGDVRKIADYDLLGVEGEDEGVTGCEFRVASLEQFPEPETDNSKPIKRSSPSFGSEERKAVMEVFASEQFIHGSQCREFEKEFASYCGTKYAIATANGTASLVLALLACDVSGGEVITVSNTFVATVNAIVFAGAKPVLVDIGEDYNLDPSRLEAAITPKTKAIIAVHLYGQMADMDAIMAIARKRGIPVIEDAAQAHASEYKGRKAGSVGDLGCFSFYPTKNMTVLGDGGMVTTDSLELCEKMAMLHDNGRLKVKYESTIPGMNLRMSEFQAAIGRAQLRKLDGFTSRRREIAAIYRKELKLPEITHPVELEGRKHVYHLYTVRVPAAKREALMKHLKERGIETSIMYPVPIHKMTAYREYEKVRLENTERWAAEILSIPMHAGLGEEDVGKIVSAIREFFGK